VSNNTIAVKNNSYSDFLNNLQSSLITYDKIEEYSDSMFTVKDNYALCISRDLELNDKSGIEFKNRFRHQEQLLKENLQIHNVVMVPNGDKFVFYLITKENYWDKSSYENLFIVFQTLRNLLIKYKQTSISVPKLGTGFDRLKWEKLRSMLRYIFKGTDIIVRIFSDVIKEPTKDQILTILKEYHCSPVSGHSGFHRTYKRIKENYKWSNMKRDIATFIKNCESCQVNKLVRKKNHKPMQITTTSSKPFERLALDVVGPLPLSESGNKYILTLQDDLTKFSQAYAIPNHEASTIAVKLTSDFICKFGIPNSILTDQGRDFTSTLLKDIAKLFKIKQIQTTAYHPQTNGALERSHITLVDYLKHYVNPDQTDWDKWLDPAMFAYNTTIHSSTNYTPYELVFGNKPELPTSILREPEFKYTYDNYLDDLTLKLRKSREIARNNISDSKQRNKVYYDRKIKNVEFKVGQRVYLLREQFDKSRKLASRYTGPYVITKINSPVNVTILVKRKKLLFILTD
jgi:His(2)-Cys(2) zinc finger./Integrase core domain.